MVARPCNHCDFDRDIVPLQKKYFMKKLLFAVISILLLAQAPLVSAQQADAAQLKKSVYYLASDELEGRKPGTKGCDKAAIYIRDAFSAAGLKLIADQGFQTFKVTTDIKAGKDNTLAVNGKAFTMGVDFSPFSISSNSSLDAEVVFAGYGFDFAADTVNWHDYNNIDVKGKWVMIFRGNPEPDNENSIFVAWSKERSKVLTAKDKGALGVLFVTTALYDKNDELISLGYDKSKSGSGIPVINIKRSVANTILAKSGKTIEALETAMNKDRKPSSFNPGTTVKANTDLYFSTVETSNVAAILEGSDPVLRNQYIVVGAHYDHLGFGGPGSGSRKPDTNAVHNGADDNASGVAAMIELARILSESKAALRRTIVFVAFSAEEMGLLGSSWYTAHPLKDLKQTVLMINFDMVGRMNNETPSISIGGTGTFRGATGMLDTLLTACPFKASYSPEGYGPSDHAPFYADSIPVLYFNTGAHGDYHTPEDDADRINYKGIAEIVDLAEAVILKMDLSPQRTFFMEAGPKEKTKNGSGMKVRLGIMPDFTNTEITGVGVGAVTKGGPADHGGILKGDIITALNGKAVANIYEYMDRMKTFTTGQTISVDIKRGDKTLVLLIQL
jgi:hypothetical protein